MNKHLLKHFSLLLMMCCFAIGLSAQITQTVNYTGGTVTVDATGNFGLAIPADIAFSFPVDYVIEDISVTVNFDKTDGSCVTPAGGLSFHNETSIQLRTGLGATAVIAPAGTWSGNVDITPGVSVSFEDGNPAPSGTPTSGLFSPSAAFSTLAGTDPAGLWQIEFGDNASGDPLCVQSFSITVDAVPINNDCVDAIALASGASHVQNTVGLSLIHI